MKNQRYLVFVKGKTTMIVDKIGGQLVSYKVNGVEILSQGALNPESSSWSATAKNLFPNPGKVGGKFQDYALRIVNEPDYQSEMIDELGDDEAFQEFEKSVKNSKKVRYDFNKIPYRIIQHGFAQYMEFRVRGSQKNGCVLSLETSPETLKQYPFRFRYNLGYELDDNGCLIYDASCSNLDDKPIVAGMGWHPAFMLHNDNVKAYRIVFTNLEKTEDCPVVEGKAYPIESIVKEGKSVTIDGIKSADVQIVYYLHYGHACQYIKMHTEAPKLVLWSKPPRRVGEKPFICIEPWNTNSRVLGELTTQAKIRDIEGANIIEPDETSYISATVEVGDEYVNMLELLPTYGDEGMSR